LAGGGLAMAKMPRVLLKISGEALSGKRGFGFDEHAISYLADEIASVSMQCELGIVVGGGNIFRGSVHGRKLEMNDIDADYTGMSATITNGAILRDYLAQRGVDIRHQSALAINAVAEPFIRLRAIRHLEKGRVVIFSGGTGNPCFTTDTAMVLRAREIGASLVLKGTKVRGIFDGDPESNPKAKLILKITHDEFLRRNLKILDATAVSLARDKGVQIRVFDIFTPSNLRRILQGNENIGSLIYSS